MMIKNELVGKYIAQIRKEIGLTQSELADRLNVSSQAVSNWERGESLPDTALLPDLALILNTSIDSLLGGGSSDWLSKKRITVEKMSEALDCIEKLRNLLGSDHFMYRIMVDALDKSMNSNIELTFSNQRFKDAYICEAILEAVKNGAYIDLDDINNHIYNQKAKEYTLTKLKEMGIK